ncbi:DUF4446 family protein [Cohnella nanjingensis]|uniref:DUF4446 family protein n=1 Tax=Cohnella nanjingensis TaxID=1387779 RepID=A0A7X0VHQ8_9BACL|nr:DUF4446 family protein [Cohnella nanjingensis]MBB6674395.1 DUF4446 family protein [Cohnella nanjingensis]
MNVTDENVWFGIAAAEGLLLLIVLIWVIALTTRLSKLRKSHRKLVGETGVAQLEDVMDALHRKLSEVESRQARQDTHLDQQEKRLAALKGRVGVHRFNAFSDQGSDLSFSIAIVNDDQDGVVITGIHSREQAFLYAKPLDKGQSAYMLSPEEKTAITQATQKG